MFLHLETMFDSGDGNHRVVGGSTRELLKFATQKQQQPADWKCHCFCKCGRGGDSLCDCPGRCRCTNAVRQRRFFPKDLICIRQERTFQRIVAKATDTEPAKMENEKITAPIEPSESSVTSQCN
jgi:hypothetical protein